MDKVGLQIGEGEYMKNRFLLRKTTRRRGGSESDWKGDAETRATETRAGQKVRENFEDTWYVT